jgi:predicted nucleotidyltransferase
MTTQDVYGIIVDYLKDYKPELIGVFGSFGRGDNSEKSDIDILIRFHETYSLLQLIRIENELSALLGVKVDLVTEGSIRNKRIRKNIQKDLKIIFEA